jgi:ABC-2 type transport system ATP-binding protein
MALDIEAKGLTRRFGQKVAVEDFTFEVNEGQVVGLLGPNGAGKTTTIRMLACLVAPTEGDAKVAGYDVRQQPNKVRAAVGLLTENPGFYERLSAAENLEFYARAYGVGDPTKRNARIRELMQLFDLWESRNEKVGVLSRGMKQKLAIVRAVSHDPPVVLLDEPTATLDPRSSRLIKDLITKTSREDGRAILLSTHRLEDAELLCGKVVVLNNGKKISEGTPSDLKSRSSHDTIVEMVLLSVNEGLVRRVEKMRGVAHVQPDYANSKIVVTVGDYESDVPAIVRGIASARGRILSVKRVEPSLEDVYLSIMRGEGIESR